jgi:3-hydroxyisobutyrate dehydrogenase-like beta-hydroxyacid dehydrogenase
VEQTGKRIGFVGLGVMGEPMCRNLALKSGAVVVAFDRETAPMQRLAEHGVRGAASLREVVEGTDVVFLSLPSGEVVRDLSRQPQGLLALVRSGQIVVDLSTSPVDLTRELASEFAARGATLIDAPVARTRAAAEAGKLSVMVGGEPEQFARVKPLIATFASDITLCGPVGCGQVVKILNNMVLFETVVALCEARLIGERAGVDPALLFDTMSKGSADSFALRNHGLKAIVPGEFPERAFSVEYARKDLRYAIELARRTGVEANGAQTVDRWFVRAVDAGDGGRYFPVISRLMGG